MEISFDNSYSLAGALAALGGAIFVFRFVRAEMRRKAAAEMDSEAHGERIADHEKRIESLETGQSEVQSGVSLLNGKFDRFAEESKAAREAARREASAAHERIEGNVSEIRAKQEQSSADVSYLRGIMEGRNQTESEG